MIAALGPRARRIYMISRDNVLSGAFAPGAKLPSQTALAAQFRVATRTVRHVLAQLEQEGLVSRQHGRGTFAQARTTPARLLVEDDPSARPVLQPRPALAASKDCHGLASIVSTVRHPLVVLDGELRVVLANRAF